MKQKIKLPSEVLYLFISLAMSFSVAMTAAADFGVSMIVAPSYVLSLKFDFLTFGQWEYVIQSVLFISICIIVRKFKPVYFVSFLSCLIYGAFLDLWRMTIPAFSPATDFSAQPIWLRITFLALGMTMTAFTVALSFKVYLFPQVYDFFVKAITEHYPLNRTKFKICFDAVFLIIGVTLSLLFFPSIHELKGIGIGTLVMTLFNGILIGLCGKFIDKCFEVKPLFPKLVPAFSVS